LAKELEASLFNKKTKKITKDTFQEIKRKFKKKKPVKLTFEKKPTKTNKGNLEK
jgi:hypothetical protein